MDTATIVSTTQNQPLGAEVLKIVNAGCGCGCDGSCGCGSVRTQPIAEQACDCGCIIQTR